MTALEALRSYHHHLCKSRIFSVIIVKRQRRWSAAETLGRWIVHQQFNIMQINTIERSKQLRVSSVLVSAVGWYAHVWYMSFVTSVTHFGGMLSFLHATTFLPQGFFPSVLILLPSSPVSGSQFLCFLFPFLLELMPVLYHYTSLGGIIQSRGWLPKVEVPALPSFSDADVKQRFDHTVKPKYSNLCIASTYFSFADF